MKVRFLGTNGWYDTQTGNTLCVLIESGDMSIVLDAGNGIHKLDRYVKEKPAYLFLSHFHLDHIEGMHTMVKMRLESLSIFGMEGTEKILNDVIRRPYTVPLAEYPYPVTVGELPRDMKAGALCRERAAAGARLAMHRIPLQAGGKDRGILHRHGRVR